MNPNITCEFQSVGNSSVSRYYFLNKGKVFAQIEKYQDTKTETNPFKVSRWDGERFKPDVAFWPDFADYSSSKNSGGYFKAGFGGFTRAQRHVEDIFDNLA